MENYPPCWVTRHRHPNVEQLPHPDAMDEWIDGKSTGRIKKTAPGGSVLIGMVEEVDDWLSMMPTKALFDGAEQLRKLINKGELHKKHNREIQGITHSGLKRSRYEEDRLRGMIDKFISGGELSELELRFLIQYYGIMIRMCEMSGQRYYLAQEDAWNQHQHLLKMADQRGWTQAIINMYGGMIEGVFEKIC